VTVLGLPQIDRGIRGLLDAAVMALVVSQVVEAPAHDR